MANFVAPFLPVYLGSGDASAVRANFVLSFFSAGTLVGLAVAGVLTDRLGRRATLFACLLASAAGACGLAVTRSTFTMSGAVFLFGAGAAASRAPIRAMVGDLVAPHALTRAFGLLYWADNVGTSVSLLGGGYVASLGWTVSFVLDAGTTVLFALVVLVRLPETRPAAVAARTNANGYQIVRRDRAFVVLLSLLALFNLAYTQAMVTLPLQLAGRGYAADAIGAVLAVSAVLVTVVQPVVGRVLGMTHSWVGLAAGCAVTGIGLGAQALCSTPTQFAVAVGVWTLGEIAVFGTIGAAVTELAPQEARGRYASAAGLCFAGSRLIGTPLGALALQELGGTAVWLGCFCICGAASVGLVCWGRLGAVERKAVGRSAGAKLAWRADGVPGG